MRAPSETNVPAASRLSGLACGGATESLQAARALLARRAGAPDLGLAVKRTPHKPRMRRLRALAAVHGNVQLAIERLLDGRD